MKATLVPLATFALLALPLVPAHAATNSWWLKGASMIPSGTEDFSSDAFKQSVRNLQALGGTYVNFVIPYYQSNLYSTDIAAGYNTPSDSSLAAGIDYVHSLGMHAEISIYLESYTGEWRAGINPGDRDTWYRNYGNVLVHYGQLGQAHGAELYQLGAELIDMASASQNGDNTARWETMIAAVRSVYHGKLTYSANRGQQGWASELPNIGFWDSLDYVGVSAYYELPGDGSVASMMSDWDNIRSYDIDPIHNKTGKPVIFTEVGYRSVSDAHDRPWDSWDSGAYDASEQQRDYEALLAYWGAYSYMQGATFWWWSPNPGYGGSGNTDYTPQNKPVQDTLKQWWSGSATPPGTPPPANPPPSNPPPTPSSATTDNWWPVDGVHVSGLQPFKAMLEGVDISQYQMYWQVDGGNLVPMSDAQQDYPHKEALVDLSGWTWHGGGPYVIQFVSKNASGQVISTKALNIFVP